LQVYKVTRMSRSSLWFIHDSPAFSGKPPSSLLTHHQIEFSTIWGKIPGADRKAVGIPWKL
jgi:hypothetical protein